MIVSIIGRKCHETESLRNLPTPVSQKRLVKIIVNILCRVLLKLTLVAIQSVAFVLDFKKNLSSLSFGKRKVPRLQSKCF